MANACEMNAIQKLCDRSMLCVRLAPGRLKGSAEAELRVARTLGALRLASIRRQLAGLALLPQDPQGEG